MTSRNARSALGISFIGVGDMGQSLTFYRDVIGLTVTDSQPWSGGSLAAQWQCPPGSEAEAVLATFPGSRVGRVMLVKFHADSRQEVRAGRETTWIGLGNLNFYNNHIHDTALRLRGSGYRFWSRPTTYEMSEAVGISYRGGVRSTRLGAGQPGPVDTRYADADRRYGCLPGFARYDADRVPG